MLAEAGLTAERVGAGRWAPAGANGFGSPGIGSCVGGQGYGRRAGTGDDSGFPTFSAMSATQPDFFVCNGDIIYADNAIEEVATTFCCLIGLSPAVTAITFVALGTSLPDTFASKTSAVQDECLPFLCFVLLSFP